MSPPHLYTHPANSYLMLSHFRTLLCWKVRDVRGKVLIDRAREAKVRKGFHLDDLSDAMMAKECGLLPPEHVSARELQQQKAQLMTLLSEQKLKRIARREAFLEWQAGQREKGAAHRLVRQAKTAEKYKRHHYHSRKGKILSIGHINESGMSSNADPWEGVGSDLCRTTQCYSSAEFLTSGSAPHLAVHLSMSKK